MLPLTGASSSSPLAAQATLVAHLTLHHLPSARPCHGCLISLSLSPCCRTFLPSCAAVRLAVSARLAARAPVSVSCLYHNSYHAKMRQKSLRTPPRASPGRIGGNVAAVTDVIDLVVDVATRRRRGALRSIVCFVVCRNWRHEPKGQPQAGLVFPPASSQP